LAVLGGLEILLSVTGTEELYRRDAFGGWQVQAGMSNHRMRGTREPHDFVLSTNPDGLRTKHTLHKEPDSWRIALMGDSNVFGWGVHDEETLAARLEQALHAAGETDAQVINAGQPGHSTTQMRWFFEEVLAHYQPDLVLLVPSLHDHNRAHVSDAEALDGARGPVAALRVGLARHSRIYAALASVLSPLAGEPQLLPDQAGVLRVDRVSDAERSDNLDRIAAGLELWGGQLALALLPFHADLAQPRGDKPPSRPGEDWAREHAAARGLDLLDVRTCCGPDADSLVFSFDPGHLNAAGLVQVGRALADVIRRSPQ
jgi:lysophospholipase L1-like esterase